MMTSLTEVITSLTTGWTSLEYVCDLHVGEIGEIDRVKDVYDILLFTP